LAPQAKKLPDGYEFLIKGAGPFDVVVRTATKDQIAKEATDEQVAGLEDLLERFGKLGPQGLARTKLNGNEGWFPSEKAPGKIRLQAFKPWQLRAYGFVRDFNGSATFFITGCDCSKKQDKANQKILKAAGDEAFRINKILK
jgi:hypothetical protein